LARLTKQTAAPSVAVAGGYEVTGTKLWTSYAHEWHFVITLVRTSPAETDIHGGLSQLILDLKAPSLPIRFARTVVDIARRHLRDPARNHRPPARAAVSRRTASTARPTILPRCNAFDGRP
jgi:hypothetical protein